MWSELIMSLISGGSSHVWSFDDWMKAMCGGEILVNGNAGLLPAISNNGGTIIIEGDSTMAAVEMKKGTVVVKGQLAELMPSYREEGTEEYEGETYRKFTGDVNVSGKGVLLVK